MIIKDYYKWHRLIMSSNVIEECQLIMDNLDHYGDFLKSRYFEDYDSIILILRSIQRRQDAILHLKTNYSYIRALLGYIISGEVIIRQESDV